MNTKLRFRGSDNGYSNCVRIDFDNALSGRGKVTLTVGNKAIERGAKGSVCLLPIPECDSYEVGIKMEEALWQENGGEILKSIQLEGRTIYNPIPN